MARVHNMGAELGSIALENLVDVNGSGIAIETGAGLVYKTLAGNGGTYSLKVNANCCAGKTWRGPQFTGGGIASGYIRFRFQRDGVGSVVSYPIRLHAGTTDIASVRIDTDYKLSVLSGGSVVATSTLTIAEDTYYRGELYFNIHDTTGELTLRNNGVQWATFSGDTKPGADTTVDRVGGQSSDDTTLYMDDIAVNSTTGSINNSWPGDQVIAGYIPASIGTTSGLTGSDADQTDNYLLVDDIPFSESDYVEASGAELYDSYGFNNLPAEATAVAMIEVVGWAARNGTTINNWQAAIRQGGVDRFGASQALGDAYSIVYTIYDTSPDDSAAWAPADFNDAEIGQKFVG